jgi:hypothetical protein
MWGAEKTRRREFLKSGVAVVAGGLPAFREQLVATGKIPIVVSPQANDLEKLAARELASHIERIYPNNRFPILFDKPGIGPSILLGTFDSFPDLRHYASADELSEPESFTVKTSGRRAIYCRHCRAKSPCDAVRSLHIARETGLWLLLVLHGSATACKATMPF